MNKIRIFCIGGAFVYIAYFFISNYIEDKKWEKEMDELRKTMAETDDIIEHCKETQKSIEQLLKKLEED